MTTTKKTSIQKGSEKKRVTDMYKENNGGVGSQKGAVVSIVQCSSV